MVLDNKKIEEIKKIVPRLINEGIICKKEDYKKLIDFFRENAEDSLDSAQLLYNVSTDSKLQDATGFPNLRGFLWVINASYYSMFYMASSLLASSGIKIKSEIGIHKLTFNTFVYYFYLTNKIAKEYIEQFLEALEDSEELLGKDDVIKKAEAKAKELVNSFDFEREKRRTFTYELERTKIQTKAKTSLERANYFYKEIIKLIKKGQEEI